MTVPPRANGVRLSEQEARDLAGAFLFTGRAQESTLGSLSGGERARAVLAGLVAGAHNLLILDEPSNHLDIPSAERLEQALSLPPDEGGYDGTLILVSHDRALLTATCDQILSIDGDGKWRLFQGTYAEFDAQRVRGESVSSPTVSATAKSSGTSAQAPAKVATKAAPPKDAAQRSSSEKNSGSKTTTIAKAPRPRTGMHEKGNRNTDPKNPLSHIPQPELELLLQSVNTRLAAIDDKLGDPEIYADRKKTNTLLDDRTAVEREKSKLEEEWLRRATG